MQNSNLEVRETLNDYLIFINKEIDSICNLLNEENNALALEKIMTFTEKIEILLEATIVVKIDVDIEQLNDILNQIVDALQNEDYILVCDLFEYEIKPIISEINKENSLNK